MQDFFGSLGTIALFPIVMLFGLDILNTKNFNSLDCTCACTLITACRYHQMSLVKSGKPRCCAGGD